MIDEDTLTESARTVGKVADAYKETLRTASKLGEFMKPYLAGPLHQVSGFVEERIWQWRVESMAVFAAKTEQRWALLGLEGPQKPIPIDMAWALFDAASKTSHESLQELWANLLVNATTANSAVELRRSYISLLEELSPDEALIMQKIYEMPYDLAITSGVVATNLPNEASLAMLRPDLATAYSEGKEGRHAPLPPTPKEPPEEVCLSIANLARLNCISLGSGWDDNQQFSVVRQTLLGRKFIEACTLTIEKP